MLSSDTRLKLEFIADRIAKGAPVSLEEMTWAQKWANHNRSAASILSRARRQALQGDAHPESLDGLLQGLDLGDPDPSRHLSGPQNPIDLAEWFLRDDEGDWRQHD
jgi:hypothetical protein